MSGRFNELIDEISIRWVGLTFPLMYFYKIPGPYVCEVCNVFFLSLSSTGPKCMGLAHNECKVQ